MAQQERLDFRIGATDAASAAFRSVQRSINDVQVSYGKLTGVLAGGTAIAGFVASMRNVVNVADEVNKASQKFGVPVESLTSLKFAAQLANVEFDTLQLGLKTLSTNAAAAAGGSREHAAAFEAMGIAVKDAGGNVKGTDQLLGEIANKFEGYTAGITKTALAAEVFSARAGPSFIPLLNNLREAQKEARDLGAVYGKEFSQAAEDFNDSMTRVNATLDAQKVLLAGPLLSALNKYMNELLAAQKVAGGFFSGLGMSMTTFTGDPIGRLNEIRKKLEGFKALRAEIDASAVNRSPLRYIPFLGTYGDLGDIDRQIAALEKERAFLTELASRRGDRDNFDLMGRPTTTAPVVPRGAAGARGQEDNTFRQLLQQYEQMVAKAGELTVFEQTVNLLQTERYAKLTEGERQRILDLAKRVDAETQHARIVKQAADSEADIMREAQELGRRFTEDQLRREDAEAKALDALRQKYEDMINPVAELMKQLAELERLRGAFPQMAETWAAAEQHVLKAALAMDSFKDSTEEVSEAARDLGHAIGTAFEDAVIEMKSASDVAKALAQDFARIMLRQAVTKPLEGVGENLFKAALLAFGGGGGGSTASMAAAAGNSGALEGALLGKFQEGTPYVPRTGLALLHKGEAVIPEAMNQPGARNTMSIDARTYVDARGATQEALPGIVAALGNHERAIARLLENDPYRRGGATRQLLRR
jgi:hypothetical protein